MHAAQEQPMAVADPLTGAGAYVPSGDTAGPISHAGNPDPFTGGGAYVPDEAMTNPSRQSVPSPPGLSFAPHQHYQGFEAVPDGSKVLAKLRELSPDVQGVHALSAEELAQGGALEDIVAVRFIKSALRFCLMSPQYAHVVLACAHDSFRLLMRMVGNVCTLVVSMLHDHYPKDY